MSESPSVSPSVSESESPSVSASVSPSVSVSASPSASEEAPLDALVTQLVAETVSTDGAGQEALVTQVVAEVVSGFPPVMGYVTHLVVETVSPTYYLYECPGIPAGISLCGADVVLTWIEQIQQCVGSPSTLTRVTSDITLPDAAAYYQGKKEGRVLWWGSILRRLSSTQGQWEGATMSWTEAEVDRVLRGRLASGSTRALTNTQIVCRMIREQDWLSKFDPRIMFIGHVLRVVPNEDMGIQLEAGDELARAIETKEIECPRRLCSPLYFPGLPEAAIDLPEPIIYGELTGEMSDVTPPVLTGDPARGAYVDGGTQVFGYGNIGNSVDVPYTVALTENAGAGSIVAGDAPSDTFYAFVTAIDNTEESDPSTFAQRSAALVDSVTITGAAPGCSITVTWDYDTDPDNFRVYLGWNYYGVRVVQYLSVAGSAREATFDNTPSYDEWILNDYTNLATGAAKSPYQFFADWAVSAVVDGAESELSAVGTGRCDGYRRPIRVEWESVPNATEYRVYRRPYAGAAYDRRWVVAVGDESPYLDDDLLDTNVDYITDAPSPRGIVPIIYTGQETLTTTGESWYRFMVCGHAIKAIDQWYLDGTKETTGTAGVDYLIPGYTGWTDRFGSPVYRDYNGRRYTMIYARGPKGDALAAGTSTLTLNVRGIENSTAADGTGDLIDDIHEQFLHWMINFGPLGDYQTGAWLDAPTWDPIASHCRINAASFRAMRDQADGFVAGGYVGGGYISELAPVRDWMSRWCISTDTRIGQSASGQWEVTRHVPDAETAVVRTYTDIRHVQAGSLTITPVYDEHWNTLPYQFQYQPIDQTWGWTDQTVTDDASVEAYGETREAPSTDMYFVRSATVASNIMERMLVRHADPPLQVTFDTIDLCGTLSDLGDVIGLTHMAGTDPSGWTSFKLFVEGVIVHPDTQRTTIETRAVIAPHLTEMSPSVSVSPSTSASKSPSISTSPSVSTSPSTSFSLSATESPSVSPSVSVSPSGSSSKSPSISPSSSPSASA